MSSPQPNYHSLSKEEKASYLNSLSTKAFNSFFYSGMILQDYQIIPEGDWRYCLFLAGRGTGKTLTGAEWIADKVRKGCKHLAICAATYSDLQRVMVPALQERFPKNDQPHHISGNKNIIECKNGVKIHCLTLENESSRGGNYEYVWVDEAVKACDGNGATIAERIAILDFAVRIGKAQMLITTTPKPMDFLKNYVKRYEEGDESIIIKTASTKDNQYLAESAKKALYKEYDGSTLGRQELEGEILWETTGALWSIGLLDATRAKPNGATGGKEALETPPMEEFDRFVIGVDPAASTGSKADETGIVVAGLHRSGHVYVFTDGSGSYSPDQWGRKVANLYDQYSADRVIAEKNNGGDMVSYVLRAAKQHLPIKLIHAKLGKRTRAEPVQALYEQQLVHHVGYHAELEKQMCSFTTEGKSRDDRVDALVYAISELVLMNTYSQRGGAQNMMHW